MLEIILISSYTAYVLVMLGTVLWAIYAALFGAEGWLAGWLESERMKVALVALGNRISQSIKTSGAFRAEPGTDI